MWPSGFAREPPKSIPAERLFRLLSDPDRPSISIQYRIAGAENVPLEVKAPTPSELARALDADGEDPEGQQDAARRAIIATTLWAGGGRAFRASEDLGRLYADEVEELWRLVVDALGVIAPSLARSDPAAWRARLEDGARSSAAGAIAVAMAQSREVVALLKRPQPRADRFYGRAIALLTEGQLWAYMAGCHVVDQIVG